ncbi:MAG: right-handed parallel beta-helix repeat-containing protein [Solirubrobacteraceae bacterium]
MRARAALAGLMVLVTLVVVLVSTGRLSPALPSGVCGLFASPSGSDASGNGSRTRPFATVARLDRALSPGQTGCLQSGTYGDTSTWHQVNTNGTSTGQIILSAAPGATVKIVGWVDIEGSYTTLENVAVDGSNSLYAQHPAGVNCPGNTSQPLVLAGTGDVLQYVDYYQSVASMRGNAIGVGFWGNADNTVIRYSKIHDVGQCMAYDHLIYLSHGNNVRIYGNWMYDDPHGDAVQLYPAPTNARIYANVIDQVGEGFVVGNSGASTVSGNQIYDNVISNSTGLATYGLAGDAIHDIWDGTPGTGNTFTDNVLYNNPGGLGRITAIHASGNITANPQYTNPAIHAYQVPTTSPAAALSLWNGIFS